MHDDNQCNFEPNDDCATVSSKTTFHDNSSWFVTVFVAEKPVPTEKTTPKKGLVTTCLKHFSREQKSIPHKNLYERSEHTTSIKPWLLDL